MKDFLKSKGIIAFLLFIILISFIPSIETKEEKNASAANTNIQIIEK